jgi:ubiquinone/menaquinone biosynthesis C-methylase UbiE
MPADDPFSPEQFDPWARTYDEDVASQSEFPFNGHQQVLDAVVRLTAPQPAMSVLDLGTGTGNLAVRLAAAGCELWCSDFSEEMLQAARRKLPRAHFSLHDLRAPWPADLARRFDRIVSAYVFHHFELAGKVALCEELASRRITPGGRLVIADLSFADRAHMEQFAHSVGKLWEQEPYWLADVALDALRHAGLRAEYVQISPCAGVYSFGA